MKHQFWRNKANTWTKEYGWNPYVDSNDADSSILYDLNEQKTLAEELLANHPIAKSVINNASNHTVLNGLTFSADTKDDKLNDIIETELTKWSKKKFCDATRKQDINGIYETIVRNYYTYGENFGLIVDTDKGASFRGIPYNIVSSDENKQGLIKNGVEVDKYGTPIRLHIKTADGKTLKKPYFDSDGNPIVLHAYQQNFWGQSHGQIPITSCYNLLLDLSVFIKSEVAAAALSSQIAFITKQNNIEAKAATQAGWNEKQNQDGSKTIRTPIMSLKPGMMINLNPGESIEQFKLERPSGMFVPFVSYVTKIVCSAFGLSYEYLFTDWADSNFSSARVNAIQTQGVIKKIQKLIIESSIKPLVDAQLRHLHMTGVIKGDLEKILDSVTVNPPVMPLLDPVKEVTAAKARLDAGLSTLQKECVTVGTGDYAAIMQQQAREAEERQKLGLKETSNTPIAQVGKPPSEGSTRG